MDQAHAKSWQEVVDHFGTDVERGLSNDLVKKYQDKYGPNGMHCYYHNTIYKLYLSSVYYMTKQLIIIFLLFTELPAEEGMFISR